MRKAILLAGVLSVVPFAGAMAQTVNQANLTSDNGQVEISGVAPAGCVIAAPAQGAVSNATVIAGQNAAQITVNQLVNPDTAVPQSASVSMAFPVTCNTAHLLTVSTAQGGLRLESGAAAPGPGFRNRLDYQVTTSWVGQSASGASDAGPLQINSANAASGQLSVSIDIPGGGDPLEAGTYSDSIVVSLQPTS